MQHCWKTCVSCWNRRPRATRCGRCGGLEEPRQAGSGAVRDGASGQQEHHPQTVGVAAERAAGELQDAGRCPQSRSVMRSSSISMPGADDDGGRQSCDLDRHGRRKSQFGPYNKNAGSDYRPKRPSRPGKGADTDFVDAELGKVVPYGVYYIAANAGCVSVGIDNDTAQFSVNSICRWSYRMGWDRDPDTDQIIITADGGGFQRHRRGGGCSRSNCRSSPTRPGLTLQVCHYPPGRGKWNKIEHRPFWPDHRELAANALDEVAWRWSNSSPPPRPRPAGLYLASSTRGVTQKGIKKSEEEMASLNIKGDTFHPAAQPHDFPQGHLEKEIVGRRLTAFRLA